MLEASELVNGRAGIRVWANTPDTLSFIHYTFISVSPRPSRIWDEDSVFSASSTRPTTVPCHLVWKQSASFFGNSEFHEVDFPLVAAGGSWWRHRKHSPQLSKLPSSGAPPCCHRAGRAGGGVAPGLIAQTGSRGSRRQHCVLGFLYGPSIWGSEFTFFFLTNRLFKGNFNFTEKEMSQKHSTENSHLLPLFLAQFSLCLIKVLKVLHLLKLMNQYWYVIMKSSSLFVSCSSMSSHKSIMLWIHLRVSHRIVLSP